MRPNAITTALALAAAAFAVPAVAAPPRGEDEHVFPRPQAAVETAADVARAQRAARSGPVHPLRGKPDYGTAENAFGARSGRGHDGQDVFAPAGTPLVAVADAVVIEAGGDGAAGNHVHLYDRRANRTYVYMHLLRPPEVRDGERVRTGQRLGGVGCTGSCWGDHLHFEVREGRGWAGEPVDPLPLLRRWPVAPGRG